MQYSYLKYYLIENTLLKIQNDIRLSIDQQNYVILLLLDLLAAFDTVDQ